MYRLRRLAYVALFVTLVITIVSVVPRALNPTPPSPEEKRRDKQWVDSSPYWLDRQACRWFAVCGVHHLHQDPAALPGNSGHNSTDDDGGELRRIELRSLVPTELARHWLRVRRDTGIKEGWEHVSKRTAAAEPGQQQARTARQRRSETESKHKEIPDYVLKHAPLVHLFSGENFWPSPIGEHLKHMTPYSNGSALYEPNPLTLDNLFDLNSEPNPVFLSSDDDVETRPEWLHSHMGIPVPFEGDDDNDNDKNKKKNRGSRRKDNDDDIDPDPRELFPDGTSWFDVDRDHPLQRISDPRKLSGYGREPRIDGPSDVRTRRLRAHAAETAASRHYASATAAAAAARATAQQVLSSAGNSGETVHTFGSKPDASGYSAAPAILVMVDKGSGIMDAFWFFFYSYNLGQTVLKVRYGNHVGDWEHCMIRFEDGVPRALFLSEHAGGQAYAWAALEKFQPPPPAADGDDTSSATASAPLSDRPVIYSAVGSHAMYAFPGKHPYVLPFEMLADETDKGPLWDPAQNNLAYFYDYVADREQGGDSQGNGDIESQQWLWSRSLNEESPSSEEPDTPIAPQAPTQGLTSLTPAASNPDAPTSWFHFNGTWGDELYELGDSRQWRLFGQYHYITGPQGPKFKNLDREKVCQTEHCQILYSISEGKKAAWYS